MSEVERYVQEVMRNTQAPPRERQRIEADLRAHLEEAMRAGEPASVAIGRMGTPAEVAAEFMAQMALPYAGFWRRLGAFAVDLAIIVLAAGIVAVLGLVASNQVPQRPQGIGYVLGAIAIAATVGCALAVVGIVLLYFPLLEARFGRTVGKRLLGLRVLQESGLPIGLKEAFLRRLSFYFEVLAVDALFVLFTARHQRAFDIVARTVVIQEARRSVGPRHPALGVAVGGGGGVSE